MLMLRSSASLDYVLQAGSSLIRMAYSTSNVASLLANGTSYVFSKHRVINHIDRPVLWHIKRGVVAIYGCRNAPALMDIRGDDAMILDGPFTGDWSLMTHRIVALSEVEAVYWSEPQLLVRMADSTKLSMMLLHIATEHSERLKNHIEQCTTVLPQVSLMMALYNLPCIGEWPNGDRIVYHIPQTMLGEYVGVAREAIGQHMRLFRRAGLITYKNSGSIWISNRLRQVLAIAKQKRLSVEKVLQSSEIR